MLEKLAKSLGMTKGALGGILKFSILVALILLAAFILGVLTSNEAHAANKSTSFPWVLKEQPYVYFGLELEKGDSFCVNRAEEWEKNWVSNGGFGKTIWRRSDWRLDFLYRHHSCAFLVDNNSYDAVGFTFFYQYGSRRFYRSN